MTIIECLDHPDPIIKREVSEFLNNADYIFRVGSKFSEMKRVNGILCLRY